MQGLAPGRELGEDAGGLLGLIQHLAEGRQKLGGQLGDGRQLDHADARRRGRVLNRRFREHVGFLPGGSSDEAGCLDEGGVSDDAEMDGGPVAGGDGADAGGVLGVGIDGGHDREAGLGSFGGFHEEVISSGSGEDAGDPVHTVVGDAERLGEAPTQGVGIVFVHDVDEVIDVRGWAFKKP